MPASVWVVLLDDGPGPAIPLWWVDSPGRARALAEALPAARWEEVPPYQSANRTQTNANGDTMNLAEEVDLYVRGLDKRPSQQEADQFRVICERTGLSPLSRQIYLVNRGGKSTPQVSIDGFRAIAARSPRYVGQDGPYYVTAADGVWSDIPPDGAPYAAKVGVKVLTDGGQVVTTYAVAKYRDYSAGGQMWQKFSATMIAKCAEALALRKALPAEMSGLYTDVEMDQSGGGGSGRGGTGAPGGSAGESEAATPSLASLLEKLTAAKGDRSKIKPLLGEAKGLGDADQVTFAEAVRAAVAAVKGD